MSNHPLGLSGEPFISPPTLSRRDAARLIRRRVSAVGGDGATLFPTETCDEIHRLAGGIPEAMFHLAREAMQVASEAKASSVSPAHVREAAGGAPIKAGADASTRDVAESSMPADETGCDDAEQDHADAVETPADVQARGDEPPVISAGGFMLPSEPSEHLPQDAAAWVSRFLPSQVHANPAPVRVARSARPRRGGHAGARVARAPTIHVPTPLDPGDIPGAADVAKAPATLARTLPRHASPRRRPRSRRGGVGGGIVSVAAIMCIVAVVVLQVRRGALNSDRETSHIVPTSAPVTERASTDSDQGSGPKRNASDPPVEPERTLRAGATERRSDHRGGANAAEGTPGVVEKRAAPEPSRDRTMPGATSPASASARRPTTVATGAVTRPETPAARFGLEVATSIFEERARTERQRLAAAGYNVRLVTSQEYGSTVYCVVLGSYPQREAAERAADTLLSGGTVLQARIVTLPPER
jgi:septal ring-binding cell division protein DamX